MKVIITGSTGMVGKGILLECLESSEVESVLVLNRSSIGIENPKLKEIIIKDFDAIADFKEQLKGFDACFHSMGISVIGLSEEAYTKITYGYTKKLADILFAHNPKMVFNYVSGTGTDSSEKGRVMWARVKGKTENMLFKKGFKDVYAFRPGFMLPEKGIKSKTGLYNTIYVLFRPLFPIFKKMDSVTTTTLIGKAMINSVLNPISLKFLVNKDINVLGNMLNPH
jgi:uncharacterized protein YbjT (DUF2867 family)